MNNKAKYEYIVKSKNKKKNRTEKSAVKFE